MPPTPLPLPSSLPQTTLLHATPLTPEGFSPFGTAIIPPLPSNLTTSPTSLSDVPNSLPPSAGGSSQPPPILANQGSAVKFSNISIYNNTYHLAPSALASHNAPSGKDGIVSPQSKGKPAMSMFSSFPRSFSTRSKNAKPIRTFPVTILERHSFTTQTFIPLNTTTTSNNKSSSSKTRYLVIVAPSLPNTTTSKITNPPDLTRLHAFIATPGTAVTYGVGTWHAPMVVLGNERIDYVVVQWTSGVAEEDCQEVVFGGEGEGREIEVVIEEEEQEEGRENMKAKL